MPNNELVMQNQATVTVELYHTILAILTSNQFITTYCVTLTSFLENWKLK